MNRTMVGDHGRKTMRQTDTKGLHVRTPMMLPQDPVATRHASRYALVPLLRDEPIGEERLLEPGGRVLTRV